MAPVLWLPGSALAPERRYDRRAAPNRNLLRKVRGDSTGAERAMRLHVGKVTVASIDFVNEHKQDDPLS